MERVQGTLSKAIDFLTSVGDALAARMVSAAEALAKRAHQIFGSQADAVKRHCGLWGLKLKKDSSFTDLCKVAEQTLLKEEYVGRVNSFINDARKECKSRNGHQPSQG